MSCKLFWQVIRCTYPWLSLAITLWRMIKSTGIHRSRAQVRFWILFSRIDFANLILLANELIQPEYWA
ncbi:hypothetical protein BCD64_11015 [Nostoc sp. MBR 210]|uniref:Transposase n=1 Tax=Nostoc spongiaeforme FACHB-130 TaxID=1357510 RepID=A0ABR8FZF2_9NOSO|nr:hypothetical protein [Nostoc spongiaeforme]MBD2595917.1 hypothetical protein [Nostoc spongiaeforme FACHB-130]OCQ99570.1 hypothetical protein BCD64_11015 [Nostoc sp. MBR 210]